MIEYVDSEGDRTFVNPRGVAFVDIKREDGETTVVWAGGARKTFLDKSGDLAKTIREWLEYN